MGSTCRMQTFEFCGNCTHEVGEALIQYEHRSLELAAPNYNNAIGPTPQPSNTNFEINQ